MPAAAGTAISTKTPAAAAAAAGLNNLWPVVVSFAKRCVDKRRRKSTEIFCRRGEEGCHQENAARYDPQRENGYVLEEGKERMTMMTPLTLFLSFPRRTKHIVILVSFAARCSYLYLIRFFFSLFLLHPTILAVIYKIRRLWATSDSYSTRTPSPFPQIIKHISPTCVRAFTSAKGK